MSRIVGEHEDSEEREGSSRSTQSRSAEAHADAEKDSDSPFSSNNRLNSLYAQLKHVAAAQIRQNLSLDPTDLVHEAFLRIQGGDWDSESHFRAVACLAMRHVLIDRARRRQAARRGGGQERVTLSGLGIEAEGESLLNFDKLLSSLEERDPRKAQIVQMRVYGGMELEEISQVLSISLATVKRDWRAARAWIATMMGE